ncbi:hypothetical protein FIBSPDRAFT_783370 [Athelia psychrophila]|uniref:Uncharacterized protein n=1 Tax=Athelia psychrophila TaxID=1759441 RepID=A0A166NTS0_9AGAM|nr:hypothetical protein FIBSPDRAFT_783370 [Fibularhizoctonia sp. CBS 109695]
MLSQPQPIGPTASSRYAHDADPFVVYSRSLHNYTLGLWTESRRLAEEKTRSRLLLKKEDDVERRRSAPVAASSAV